MTKARYIVSGPLSTDDPAANKTYAVLDTGEGVRQRHVGWFTRTEAEATAKSLNANLAIVAGSRKGRDA